MLRIPVAMHNVPVDKIFRPACWNAFGMDKEGAELVPLPEIRPGALTALVLISEGPFDAQRFFGAVPGDVSVGAGRVGHGAVFGCICAGGGIPNGDDALV